MRRLTKTIYQVLHDKKFFIRSDRIFHDKNLLFSDLTR